LVAITAPDAHAQNTPTYSLAVRGARLATALEALVAETHIDLAYDPPLVRDKRAHCALQDATAEDLLRCVLEGTSLDFYRLSSGLYVLTITPETVPLYGGLQGIVVDAETRQPLPRSHVMLAERTSGTTANDAGMFSFVRLPPGRYIVIATHVGYRAAAADVEVPPGDETRAEIALEADPIVVQPIVIDGLQWRLPSADLGESSLMQSQMVDNPAAGAAGVLSGLHALLGVRVNDATADIHVQGGESGEHQLTLDGAPVFLPLNFASFVGPFSPFAIGEITVHKAGFGASEGSQISGVVDVRHDVNFAEDRRLEMQVDPLSVNSRVSMKTGASSGVQSAFTAAGRLSLWDLYAPGPLDRLLHEWNTSDPFLFTLFDRSEANPRFDLVDPTTGNPRIGFRDLHAATRVRFDALQSLHASAYFGQTRLGTDRTTKETGSAASLAETVPDQYRDLFTWDTGIGQARYEVVLGSKMLATAGVRGSYYRVRHDYSVPDSASTPSFDEENPSGVERIDDGNRIYEIAAEGQIDYAVDDRNNVTVGTELIQTGSQFSILGTQRFAIDHESTSLRLATFVEDEVTISDRWTADIGSRATFLASRSTVYVEPRLALRYDRTAGPLGPFSARISTGRYRQFVSQFDVSSRSPRALVSDTRFWLASDESMSPASATHYATEWLFHPWQKWSLRFEAYLKRQHRILAMNYGTDADPQQTDLTQDQILRVVNGTVRGAGVQLRRDLGAGRAEIRYEYSAAERKDSLYSAGGESIFTPWNEPHRLELSVDVVPVNNLTLLARWRGVWGRTWGFRQGYYDFVGAFGTIAADLPPDLSLKAQRQIDRYELGHPEKHELPPVYELDVSAAYEVAIRSSRLQFRIDVLNVLNRSNVAEWHLIFDQDTYYTGEESGFLQKGERPLLPRVISLAVKWTL
jgi:hypothetical protein